jgi:Fic family protein
MVFPPDIKAKYSLQEIKDRIADKKHYLDSRRPLSAVILERLRDDFALEWTYNSNSLEGNTLTVAETKLVLQDGITVGGKSLREHFEVINHDKAITYLEGLVEQGNVMREIDILRLHELVMVNIMDDYAGRFRTGMVRIVGANFTPPNARKVADLLAELIAFVVDPPTSYDVITLATIFHHRFVWIHPFFDGNGRTVRLAMNLILMQAGYPPSFILTKDRKKYFAALNSANKGDYSKLQLMMYQAVERSINIYVSSIGGDYDDYLPTADVAMEAGVPYSQEYLSLLARQGRIDAYKEGRVWYTRKSAVEDYRKRKLK